MEIVYFLVPLTLLLVTVGVAIFSWAVKSGQYDDLEGPAHRILYDDDAEMIPDDAKTAEQKKQTRQQTESGKQTAAGEKADNDGK